MLSYAQKGKKANLMKIILQISTAAKEHQQAIKFQWPEHQRTIKFQQPKYQQAIKVQRPDKSALCQHSIENDHLIDWSEVKNLKVEHVYLKRLSTESWYTNKKPKVLNRNDEISFPAVYRKLLNSKC